MPTKPSLATALRNEERRFQPSPAPQNGGDRRLVNFRLEPEVLHELKLLALQKAKPMQALLCEGLNKIFTENNLPPIAK